MNIQSLLVFFIFICYVSKGQTFSIKCKVVDQKDETEIPYVNIHVLHKPTGVSSNSHGFFELILDESLKSDTLIFSSVGYQSKMVAIKSISENKIKLSKQIYNLQGITVYSKSQNDGNIVINRFNKMKCFVQYCSTADNWVPSRPKEPTIEAFFFPYMEKYSNDNCIKEVWLYMSNYKSTPSYFLLRLFKPNKFGAPGDDIIPKPIKVEVTKRHSLLKVDLTKYKLSMNKEGLFIGAELLIIDENKYVIKNNDKEITTLYSPFLNYVESNSEESYWLYSKGIWNIQKKRFNGGPIITKKSGQIKYLKPSISLVLKK